MKQTTQKADLWIFAFGFATCGFLSSLLIDDIIGRQWIDAAVDGTSLVILLPVTYVHFARLRDALHELAMRRSLSEIVGKEPTR